MALEYFNGKMTGWYVSPVASVNKVLTFQLVMTNSHLCNICVHACIVIAVGSQRHHLVKNSDYFSLD